MSEWRARTALWVGGTLLGGIGVTVLSLRTAGTAVLYCPLAAAGALFVSPWYGAALCMASLVMLCAVPLATRAETIALAVALVTIASCTIYAAQRQRLERGDLQRILSVVRRVSSSLDASEVLQSIVRTAREATGAKASSLRLLGPDQQTLLVRAAEGLSKAYMDKGPVDVRRSPIDRKVLRGEIVEIRNATTDPLFQYPDEARREGIVSVVCVPLQRDDEVIGVLRVYAGQPRRFSQRELRVLTALAAQAVIALRHAEMHETTLTFMRKVAHELRAPLGAIGTSLKVLLEGVTGALTDKQVEMLQRADQRVMLMLQAVSDLLSLSRARLQKAAHYDRELRLGRLLEAVVALMRPQAEKAEVRLEVEIGPDLPLLPGNPDEVEELLSNLISNAIKYTPAGGLVRASARLEADDVAVRVADTGIGIPAEELPRLFEEFHRCTNARESGIGGTGLGMAIVKAIADRHRAAVHVESQVGKGTIIEVWFPVRQM